MQDSSLLFASWAFQPGDLNGDAWDLEDSTDWSQLILIQEIYWEWRCFQKILASRSRQFSGTIETWSFCWPCWLEETRLRPKRFTPLWVFKLLFGVSVVDPKYWRQNQNLGQSLTWKTNLIALRSIWMIAEANPLNRCVSKGLTTCRWGKHLVLQHLSTKGITGKSQIHWFKIIF